MTRQLKATGAVKVDAQGFKALNKGFSSMERAKAMESHIWDHTMVVLNVNVDPWMKSH